MNFLNLFELIKSDEHQNRPDELFMIVMQIPIVLLLIIFAGQVQSSIKLIPFRLIRFGWLANIIYLFINLFIILLGKQGTLTGALGVSFDLFASFIFLEATMQFSNLKFYKSYYKIPLYFRCIIFILFFILILFLRFNLNSFLSNFFSNLFIISIDMISLFSLAVYFRLIENEFRLKYGNRMVIKGYWLFYGVLLYMLIQPLAFFIESYKAIIFIGFLGGLVAKLIIFIGIHLLIVAHAKKYINQKQLTDKLASILGRTFHEVIRPINLLDNHIKILIDRNPEREIIYNKKTKSIIEDIDNDYHRMLAIFNASVKLYDPLVGENLSEKINKHAEETLKNISLNTLAEISVMTIKNDLSYSKIENNVSINMQYSRGCNIKCFQNEVIQAISNILKNSCDAFHDGLGEIYIKTINKSEELADGIKHKTVILEIKDDGPGISEVIKDKIFIEGITSKEGARRGFGLAITKELIEKSGGTIRITSPCFETEKKNYGTMVLLTFSKTDNISINN